MSAEDTTRQVAALREELRELVASGRIVVDDPSSTRISRAEILRGLLDAINKTGGEHSTVKIGRNAAGQPTFDVSVRTGDTPAIANASEAAAEALRLYRELDELLPFVAKDGASSTSAARRAHAIAASSKWEAAGV